MTTRSNVPWRTISLNWEYGMRRTPTSWNARNRKTARAMSTSHAAGEASGSLGATPPLAALPLGLLVVRRHAALPTPFPSNVCMAGGRAMRCAGMERPPSEAERPGGAGQRSTRGRAASRCSSRRRAGTRTGRAPPAGPSGGRGRGRAGSARRRAGTGRRRSRCRSPRTRARRGWLRSPTSTAIPISSRSSRASAA